MKTIILATTVAVGTLAAGAFGFGGATEYEPRATKFEGTCPSQVTIKDSAAVDEKAAICLALARIETLEKAQAAKTLDVTLFSNTTVEPGSTVYSAVIETAPYSQVALTTKVSGNCIEQEAKEEVSNDGSTWVLLAPGAPNHPTPVHGRYTRWSIRDEGGGACAAGTVTAFAHYS